MLGAAFLVWAQSPAPAVPFATTPSVLGWDGTAETIYVRQPGSGAYEQLRFGAFAPFGLLSSAAALGEIVSGSVRFSMNTPAGPSGVGRASQFLALADFTGDGSVATGPATVTVQSSDGVVSKGTVTVAPVAPGIFTAGGTLLNGFSEVVDAQGNAGPLNYTVQANTSQPGTFVAAPMALTSASNTVYLILFGTGIRGAPQLQVRVTAGGVSLPVQYAGSQNQFPGLDQINVTVPYSLKGAGDVAIAVTAAGQAANTVHVTLQ